MVYRSVYILKYFQTSYRFRLTSQKLSQISKVKEMSE